MKVKICVFILAYMLFCSVGLCQQPLRTLGGLGAGGMNGNGFGDPVKNDYAGIDWGYDFKTGVIVNGWHNTQAAKAYADRMARQNRLRNQQYDRAFNSKPKSDFDRFINDLESRYPFLK